MTDAAVRSALEAEEKFLSVEAERYLYEMREKAYYDYRSGMYSARLDERTKIVRNLLQNGVSPELVKKQRGLQTRIWKSCCPETVRFPRAILTT